MLPLKILRKQASFNLIISACARRSKEFSQPNSTRGCDHTINAISSYWRQRFESEGVPQPLESIEHIITHVIGDKDRLHDRELSEIQLAKLEMLCHQRLRKTPLDCLASEFRLSSKIMLIPERQTELLVELLLKHVSRSCSEVCSVLEIGCSVGAVSLSLLRSCDSVRVVAIDTNVVACELTLYNARNLELDDRLSVLHATLEDDASVTLSKTLSDDRWIDLEEESFDFIVSNPPCTPIDEMPDWQREFGHTEACYGGKDGFKVIKPIIEYASNRLISRGVLLLQIHQDQPEKIKSIVDDCYSLKLSFDHVYKDLHNGDRIVEITKIR